MLTENKHMDNERRPRGLASALPLQFFKGFLRNPRQVGSVIPSSPFLIRNLINRGDIATARTVVELGPGTGVVTREMLRAMPPDSRLIAVEIDEGFARLLEAHISDPRLAVVRDSAEHLERAIEASGRDNADVIVSGIPFSTLDPAVLLSTLKAVSRALAPGGRFVAYQFRDHVRRMAEPVLGRAEVYSGLWNVPPMRIYVWRKLRLTPGGTGAREPAAA